MREAAIGVNIDGKPHPYGLLAHWLMQVLWWTHFPLPVVGCLRLPHNKLTPHQAMLLLTKQILPHTKHIAHVLADSAFRAGATMEETFDSLRVQFTIAINSSLSSGMSKIFDVGSRELSHGQGRTFQKQNIIVQLKQNGDHVTSVSSNA